MVSLHHPHQNNAVFTPAATDQCHLLLDGDVDSDASNELLETALHTLNCFGGTMSAFVSPLDYARLVERAVRERPGASPYLYPVEWNLKDLGRRARRPVRARAASVTAIDAVHHGRVVCQASDPLSPLPLPGVTPQGPRGSS